MPALTSLDISSCKKVTEAGESEVLLGFRCFLVASPSTPPPQVPPPFPALSCALCWHTEDERNTPTRNGRLFNSLQISCSFQRHQLLDAEH
jgi:hypothetical protein